MAHVALLVPLPFEAATLRTCVNDDVSLHVIGLRASGLDACCQAILDFGSTSLVLAGLAGGLSPHLAVGQVVVDAPPTAEFDNSIQRGKIITAQRVLATPAAKSALYTETGGDVVEMEAQQVRDFADEHNLPLAIVRAVSDTYAETLDPAILSAITPEGDVHIARLLGKIARRPMLFRSLMKLRRNSNKALRNLAPAVNTVTRAMLNVQYAK